MGEPARQILFGFGGVAAGVVLVLGYYCVRYGWIERRRQRRQLHAMIDAALTSRPHLTEVMPKFDPFTSMAKPVVDTTPVPREVLDRIAALPDFTLHLNGRFEGADKDPSEDA